MPQASLNNTFYEMGVRLGHELAARMLGVRASVPSSVAGPIGDAAGSPPSFADPLGDAARPLPSKPRILPGLSGRRRRPGEQPPRCGRPGCDRPSRTRGYCQTHYVQWLKAGADHDAGRSAAGGE